MGKSRLLWEFIHSHRTQGWLVLESSSVSTARPAPYLPVIDLCKSYFRIEARDDARGIREKVTGKLLTLDESLRAVVPGFLSLLDVPTEDAAWEALDPGQRRRRTIDGLRRMLLRESQVQPLCLVFEDLHWVDAETQGLLDALVESLPTARLLLLVNYRPEYSHGWGSKSYYSQLRLDPCGRRARTSCSARCSGSDEALEPLKRLLVERTEGVPFFLEESVRTLVETGALAGERGALSSGAALRDHPGAGHGAGHPRGPDRPPPSGGQDPAPDGGRHRQGRAVRAPAGHRRAPRRTTLRDGLGRLQAAEFLYETALFPELEYTFKHALTQEVAYGGLLQERRRDLHAAIVRAFETLYPGRAGERSSWLTLHAFRGEVWDRAVAYLQGSDLPNLDGFQSGLTGGDNPGAAWWMGDHEHAVRTAQRRAGGGPARPPRLELAFARRDEPPARPGLPFARPVRPGHGRPAKNLELLTGDFLHDRCYMAGLPSVFSGPGWRSVSPSGGSSARALAIGEEAVRIAETGDPGFSLVVGCAGLGNVCVIKGDFARAVAVLERGLPRDAGELDRPARGPSSPPRWARHTRTWGASDEALPLLEEAVERAAAMKLRANHSLRLARLAEAHVAAGRAESAFPVAAQALDLAQEHRERGHEAHALRLPRRDRARGARHRPSTGPRRATGRPSPWPRPSACDRSRPTATAASAACSSDGGTAKRPRRRPPRPASSTVRWT